jgi:Na+-transporting methylmalonyl-CoA/oxaloacetate decarboxylase gamma subunit
MGFRRNQSGFGMVGAVLIILVLIVIGLSGYIVLSAHKNKTNTAATQKATPAKTNTVVKTQYVVVQDNQEYLDIKEWGVRIPIPKTLESVVYAGGHYDIDGGSSPDDARLGLLSLGSDCSELPEASSAPLGWYVTFTKTDVDQENANYVKPGSTSLHDLMKSAVEIPGTDGGYGASYVAYAKPTSDCSNGNDTAAVNAATTAFAEALQGLKAGD